jgi:hypothetical protein
MYMYMATMLQAFYFETEIQLHNNVYFRGGCAGGLHGGRRSNRHLNPR